MTVSKAHIKATSKWEKENYDKILVRFPKGTKDRIKKYSDSVNGYIVKSVLDQLQLDDFAEIDGLPPLE